MNKNNLRVRRGATLNMLWENDETGAETATIIITQDGESVFSYEVPFVGLVADLSLSDEQTDLPLGVYDYMVRLDYEDGTVEKYPDVYKCKDCTLPTLTICLANDEEDES